jgi:site-specific DNA-cytosine methylase
MQKKIVVSLCGGTDSAYLSCLDAGIDVSPDGDYEYHTFETDKYASAVSRYRIPHAIHHGDANGWEILKGRDVFLLIAGFPCQPYSVAGKMQGTSDSRDLSEVMYDALEGLKPTHFLFENVVSNARHTWYDFIRCIRPDAEMYIHDSATVSAQSRKRVYITNVPHSELADKGIVLQDILEDDSMTDRDKSYCVDANYFKGGSMKMYFEKSRRQVVFNHKGCKQVGEADLKGYDIIKRVYSRQGKSPTLTTMQGGWRMPKVECGSIINRKINPDTGKRDDYNPDIKAEPRIEVRSDQKTGTLTTVQKDNVVVDHEQMYWRALTPLECERLQTLPDGWTKYGIFDGLGWQDPQTLEYEGGEYRKPISNSQRYKMIGNGFTRAVISHILEGVYS